MGHTGTSPAPSIAGHPEFISIFKRYGSLSLFERGMSTEEIIDNMDSAGVDRLMLSAFGYGELSHHSETKRSPRSAGSDPDRFTGVGTVDPRGKPMDVVTRD